MDINDLSPGDKVNITTKTYQTNYNRSLKTYSYKYKKKYTDDEYNSDIRKNKLTRPIIIIANSKNSNDILAISESNTKNNSQIKNNYQNKINNNIWKFEILILEKSKLKLISKSKENLDNVIWEKYNQNEINNFLREFKKKKSKIYKAFLKKKIEIDSKRV